MGRAVATAFAVVWFVAAAASDAAAQPQLRISQAEADAGGIVAFLDIRDRDQAVGTILPSDVTATLNGRRLEIESLRPFADTGEGILYLLLVDVSKSISPTAFALFRNAANALVNGLRAADRLAIYTVGDSVTLSRQATADKRLLNETLAALTPNSSRTQLYRALDLALQYARSSSSDWPSRRVILVLTDGEDDGSGVTVEDVRRRLESGRIPVFATGYRPATITARGRVALAALQNVAFASGGAFEEARPEDVQQVQQRMQSAASRVQMARLRCLDCSEDTLTQMLSVTYSAGGLTVSDSANVTLPVPFAFSAPRPRWIWWAAGAATALAAGAVGAALVVRRRRRRAIPPPPKPVTARVDPPPVAPPLPPTVPKPREVGHPVSFTIVRGAKPGHHVAATVTSSKPLVAGSGAQCDLVLAQDPAVAARQFEVRLDPAGLVVVDLTGGGQTLQNGVPVGTRARLEDGDLIGAGSTEVRVRFGAS